MSRNINVWLFSSAFAIGGFCSCEPPADDDPAAIEADPETSFEEAMALPPNTSSWVSIERGLKRLGACKGALVTNTTSSENAVHLSARLSGFALTKSLVRDKRYLELNIPDLGITGQIGEPALPSKGLFVELPYGIEPQLEVVSRDSSSFVSEVPVYPRQRPEVDLPEADPSFSINETSYRADRLFPEKIAEIEQVGFIRDRRVAFVRVNPLQYNPKTGEIIAHQDIEISVNFLGEKDLGEASKRRRLVSKGFDVVADRLVANPRSLPAGTADEGIARAAGDATVSGADYLIIAADHLVQAVAPLATWKTLKGYVTEVVPMSDIGTTDAEIKSYIQDAYDTWDPAPSYVLLVGDHEYIPAYAVCCDYDDNDFYSDLPYSNTAGTDYWPDLTLGRLSVSTESECSVVVEKILAYDRYPSVGDWYENTLVAALLQDYDYNQWKIYNHDCEADRWFMETAVHAYEYLEGEQGQTIHSAFVYDYECETYDYRSRFGDFLAFPHRPDHPDSVPQYIVDQFLSGTDGTSAVIDAFNDGVGLALHRDHGSRTAWGDPYFGTSHVASLTNGNMTPIVLNISCQTGRFDYASGDCLAEAMQKKAGGGAVGQVAAIRNSLSGYNDNLTHGILTAFWPDYDPSHTSNAYANTKRGAEALNFGKYFMYSYHGNLLGYSEYEFRLFHWFGDPEMEYRSQSPVTYAITAPSSISTSATSVVVGGAPEGALIGVSQDGTVLGRSFSAGSDTTVLLTTPPAVGSPVQITVTNHDMMPAELQATVI